MPKQFKTAREIHKLKVIEAGEKLEVSQPMLSAWESERKSPSRYLENIASSPQAFRYIWSYVSTCPLFAASRHKRSCSFVVRLISRRLR